ncbi:MAG: rhodanese-like domain-containing protein [Candidatus Nanohaloarchaea archaeon]
MVDTVTTEELEDMRENDEDFTLVDVLSEDHFEDGHIPGAVNIPLDRIAHEARDRFDEDDTLVVYCKDTDCGASPKAAQKLEALGFENVLDYEVGLKGWEDAGNQVEG